MNNGIEPILTISPYLDTPLLSYVKRSKRKLSIRTFMDHSFYRMTNDIISDKNNYTEEKTITDMLNSFSPSDREVQHQAIMKLVKGDWIDSKFNGSRFVYLGAICLDLDHHTLQREIRDKTLFAFNIDTINRIFNVVNTYPDSSIVKYGRHRTQERDNTTHLAQVRLPFRDSNIDESHIRIYCNKDFPPIGDYPNPLVLDSTIYEDLKYGKRCNGFTRLHISGSDKIDQDGHCDLLIKLTNYKGDIIKGKHTKIYLECNNGYLPNRQIEIDPTTGTAKARIITLGLRPGEKIKVKCGYKFYTNSSSHYLTVI